MQIKSKIINFLKSEKSCSFIGHNFLLKSIELGNNEYGRLKIHKIYNYECKYCKKTKTGSDKEYHTLVRFIHSQNEAFEKMLREFPDKRHKKPKKTLIRTFLENNFNLN